MLSGDCRPWKSTRRGPSSGRIGRMRTVLPSASTTSASHSAGYPGGSGASSPTASPVVVASSTAPRVPRRRRPRAPSLVLTPASGGALPCGPRRRRRAARRTKEPPNVMRRLSALLAAVVVAVTAAACAQEADGELTVLGGSGPDGPPTPDSSGDPGAVAEQAIVDVEAWWEDVFPEVYGGAFEPVAGYYPYGPDTPSPPCGGPPPPYEVIADNAFYCPETDIIAWDEHQLLPYLDQEFGSYTVAIVIAHEYGHAIQARADAIDRTVDLELQADCFAG